MKFSILMFCCAGILLAQVDTGTGSGRVTSAIRAVVHTLVL